LLRLFSFGDSWRMNMEHWCNHTDKWKTTYSAGTCPSATLSTTNPNDLGAREILSCVTNRLSQGTNQDFINANINYVSINVKYVLQSDTWHIACTMISSCLRTLVPKLLQSLPPAVRQKLCFNKMELMHCMGNTSITRSVWTRQFYCIYVAHGVCSLDTLRTASVIYLVKQRT
jgi:hypothetical protein